MILYPAIDLKDGRAVRLAQGALDRATVYADDAVEPGALCALCLGGLYPACPTRMTMLGLGGSAEGTVQTATQQSFLEPYRLGVADTAAHIAAVTAVLASFGESVRNAIDESDQFGDIDTSDLFTEVSRGIDYQLWLVESHRPH